MHTYKLKYLTASTLAALAISSTSVVAEPKLEFSGLVEAEFSSGKDHTTAKGSDIVLAKIELGLDAQINNNVSAHLLMLHEDDDTDPPVFEEGYINITNNALFLKAGRIIVPFGNFTSHMITDPLTLEIAEAHESALEVGYENGSLRASVYAFNGASDKNKVDSDVVDDFGFSLSYVMESSSMNLDVGFDYINNMAETDGLEGALIGANTPFVEDHTAGMAIHAIVNIDKLNVIFEYVTAANNFNTLDLGFNGGKAKPSASNIEGAYSMDVGGREMTFAIARQTTSDIDGSALPKSRIMLSVSTIVAEAVNLTVEYTDANDYKLADGGQGTSGSMLTAQLAVEF
ncbi:MAG: LbtU family siderophore porin [Gammaproteobacteria bacterium]|nr:LbtU family siderophore porin [Gammaproteobacteria bacterium]